MVLGGYCCSRWFIGMLGGSRRFLVLISGSWCFFGGFWWFLVVLDILLWFIVFLGGSWWFLTVICILVVFGVSW